MSSKHERINGGLLRERSFENNKKGKKIGHAKIKWEIQKNKSSTVKNVKISVKYKKIRSSKSGNLDDETDKLETFSCEADDNKFMLPIFEGRLKLREIACVDQ